MSGEFVSKSAVSVTEMARMVGLSRARFYQLQKSGTFPMPDQEPNTGRPYYSEEKQRTCLEVRRRNCGMDGKPILFYSRRRDCGSTPKRPTKPAPKNQNILTLLDGLNSLGLTTATAAKVDEVTKELYPNGTAGIDQGEVLRAVFLRLRRQNSGDNVGR